MLMAHRTDDSDPKLAPLDAANDTEAEDDAAEEEGAASDQAPAEPEAPAETKPPEVDGQDDPEGPGEEDWGDKVPLTEKDLNELLRDKDLARKMPKAIRGKVKDSLIEDVMQETLMALKVGKLMPRDREARIRYVCGIARVKAIRWYTRKVKDKPEVVSLDHAPQRRVATDGGIEQVHTGDVVDKLGASLPAKQQSTWQVMKRHWIDGESIAKLARETGVDASTLEKRVKALREKLAETGKGIAGLAVLLLVVWGGSLVLNQAPGVSHPDTTPSETPTEHPQEPRPGTPEAKTRAAELREEAHSQCAAEQWKKCLGSYDLATLLDPDGETPAVKAAHHQALEQVRAHER